MEEISKFCEIYMSICGNLDPLDGFRLRAIEAIMEYLESASRRTFKQDERKSLMNSLTEIFYTFEERYV